MGLSGLIILPTTIQNLHSKTLKVIRKHTFAVKDVDLVIKNRDHKTQIGATEYPSLVLHGN